MALPSTLKHFNMTSNGIGYLGKAEEVKLPKLKRKLDDFRGAGMDASVGADVGMEKMEMEFTVAGFDVEGFKQFGSAKIDGVALRFAGSYQAEDTAAIQAVEVNARGRYEEIDPGDAKSGDKGKTTYKYALTYYRLAVDGKDVLEIDILGMVMKVDGKDILADHRKAIGLA